MAVPAYIPTNSAGGFPTLHTLSSTCYFGLLILTGVRWYLMVGLIGISLVIRDVKHFFQVLLDHLYIFLGEMSIQVFCPIFHWVISFFGY